MNEDLGEYHGVLRSCVKRNRRETKTMLKKLIGILDDDHGITEESYNAIRDHVEHVLGHDAAYVLDGWVQATDGRFYLKSNVDSIWPDILEAAK